MSQNIPISILPSFWILALFIGWMNSTTVEGIAIWVIVIFFSVLIHELGHALCALACGQKVRIELGTFGGVTIRFGNQASRGKEFLIVLTGPLFGFLLAGFAYLMLPLFQAGTLSHYLFDVFLWANLFWTILNLLPIHPLDGGKLLAIACDTLFGKAGVRFSYFVSGVIASACTIFFLVLNSIIAACLFIFCAFESFHMWNRWKNPIDIAAQKKVSHELDTIEEKWQSGKKEEALSELEMLYKESKEECIRMQSLEKAAEYLLLSGRAKKACDILLEYKNTLSENALRNLQIAAFQTGNWELSLHAGEKLFLERPEEASALLNAFASAHRGNVQATINWLLSAKMFGRINLANILSSQELDPIRKDPEFEAFAKPYEA